MHPRAIPMLLDVESTLVDVLDRLDACDPDRERLLPAYVAVVDVLDGAVDRATAVVAELATIVDRRSSVGRRT